MEFSALKEVVEDQTNYGLSVKSFPREIEKDIHRWMDEEEVVVLTGIRRGGKTYIMYNLLKKFGGIYINFEDERLAGFSLDDFRKLEMLLDENKYIYLDEVQHIKGWERFVRRIHKKAGVVVSGSNASLLKGDFASALVGRTKIFNVMPLSYPEFLMFKGLKPERKSFLKYMETGGFPRVVLTEDRSLVRDYALTILYKDVIPRYSFKHAEKLEQLMIYLFSNIGKEISYRKIGEYLDIKHEETVKNYIKALEENFILKRVYRWPRSLKKISSYSKKVYAADHSLSMLSLTFSDNRGMVLENIVFNHLIKKYNVFFYKNYREVDFLACDGLKPVFGLNVAFDVNRENVKREVSGLKLLEKKLGIKSMLVSVFLSVDVGVEFKFVYEFLNSSINRETFY